jgi:hypothetical protein
MEHDRTDVSAAKLFDLLFGWGESDGDCRLVNLVCRQLPLCWRLIKEFLKDSHEWLLSIGLVNNAFDEFFARFMSLAPLDSRTPSTHEATLIHRSRGCIPC